VRRITQTRVQALERQSANLHARLAALEARLADEQPAAAPHAPPGARERTGSDTSAE